MLTEDDINRICEIVHNRPPVSSCRDSCVYKYDSKGNEIKDHDNSHLIFDTWIEIYNKREARNEKIKASVIGGLLLSAAGAVGTGSMMLLSYLREHWK